MPSASLSAPQPEEQLLPAHEQQLICSRDASGDIQKIDNKLQVSIPVSSADYFKNLRCSESRGNLHKRR